MIRVILLVARLMIRVILLVARLMASPDIKRIRVRLRWIGIIKKIRGQSCALKVFPDTLLIAYSPRGLLYVNSQKSYVIRNMSYVIRLGIRIK